MVVVDVLADVRTGALDRTLTYAVPPGVVLGIGDIVRVPLGTRVVQGFVVSEPRAGASFAGLRAVAERVDAPPLFDRAAIDLARFVAARWCATLLDAVRCVTAPGALPRTVDWFALAVERPPATVAVPPRLLRLIWDEYPTGFALASLLRHPEARRAGDRSTLLRALGTLVRSGALVRTRRFERARRREAQERVLVPGTGVPRGPRALALVDAVASAGSLRRRDATLAGFSPSAIARALRAGLIREERRAAARDGRPSSAYAGSVHTLTAAQAEAVERIVAASTGAAACDIVLQGITGSGKTLVYIEAVERIRRAGGRAIVLVPEISLTPQTARRFEAAFGERVAVLHSGLSEAERFAAWGAAAAGEIDVVVGARSAVFAPLANLRAIVIDEAHERTYKQESAPRYHAADVARERLRAGGGALVLGSATPPLEAYAAALTGRAAHVRLDDRVPGQALPSVHIVDMAAAFAGGDRRIFSSAMIEAIGARLERSEQTILFVNRRGSARFILCRSCGATPSCKRCSVALTAHRAEGLLRCHLCDYQTPLPARCPTCGSEAIKEFGVGTQRVAEEIGRLFAGARIVRMDSDTTTRVGAHADLLDRFARHGDILVGTQMVAKGLDFARVTLVGIVAADLGLHAPDFRAAERTFDLIVQAGGRSGRARPGEAIVQTYAPDHPAIRYAAAHDFDGFARGELEERRALGYPPFGRVGYIAVIGRNSAGAANHAAALGDRLRTSGTVEVLGPSPLVPVRVNDEWRYRVAVKTAPDADPAAPIRDALAALSSPHGVRAVVDIDP